MSDLKTYPVKSRIRHFGDVYEPDGERPEIDLTDAQAKRLKRFGCIGEAIADPDAVDPGKADALRDALLPFVEAGEDLSDLSLSKLQERVGDAVKGAKRAEVDAVLADLAAEFANNE